MMYHAVLWKIRVQSEMMRGLQMMMAEGQPYQVRLLGVPLQYWPFTPELQLKPRGKWRI